MNFRPLPFLGNPHVQTVLGNLFAGARPRLVSACRPVPLADGDRLMMHDSVPSAWQPAAPVALLAHGLGGSHESGYIERLTAKLLKRGVRVFRLDLRGAGAGASLARRLYNAACSE